MTASTGFLRQATGAARSFVGDLGQRVNAVASEDSAKDQRSGVGADSAIPQVDTPTNGSDATSMAVVAATNSPFGSAANDEFATNEVAGTSADVNRQRISGDRTCLL